MLRENFFDTGGDGFVRGRNLGPFSLPWMDFNIREAPRIYRIIAVQLGSEMRAQWLRELRNAFRDNAGDIMSDMSVGSVSDSVQLAAMSQDLLPVICLGLGSSRHGLEVQQAAVGGRSTLQSTTQDC